SNSLLSMTSMVPLRHYFFFSYARLDGIEAGGYLDAFVEDLEKEIGFLTGAPPSGLGFRDTTQIEPGNRWPDALAEALRSCRVFLALYSRSYFKSDYCGKEWQAFRQRCAGYSAATGTRDLPPLIVPILWAPARQWEDLTLPPEVGQIQYFHQEYGE